MDSIYYQELVNWFRRHKLGSLLHKPCISPNFETLPPHFIPWHPSSTQHLPRYLRCISFLSCRVARSLALPSLHLASSLGAHSPLVYHPGHGDVTSPLHHGHGHGATLVTSLGPGRHGSLGNHLLLPRRDCLPTLLPQRDRPGRNASPQDLEPITVRLPSGISHGKGPCSAQADLVSPKVVPVTPPVALTDNRSRHPVGPGAQPDPTTSRLDARAILSPSALAEHANLPNVLEKDLQEWST